MPQTLTHSRYCLTLVNPLIPHQNQEHVPYTHSYVCLITSRCRRLICVRNTARSVWVVQTVSLIPDFLFLSTVPAAPLCKVWRWHTHTYTCTHAARLWGEATAVFLNASFLLHILVYVVVPFFFFGSCTSTRWTSFDSSMEDCRSKNTEKNKRIKQK